MIRRVFLCTAQHTLFAGSFAVWANQPAAALQPVRCGVRPPRWRQSEQAEQLRHRRPARAPGTQQPEHERADRCKRVAIDRPKVDGPADSAARAEHVEPRGAGKQRRPDRRRPQGAPPGGELIIPPLYDVLSLGARGIVFEGTFGTSLDVEGRLEVDRPAVLAEQIGKRPRRQVPGNPACCPWRADRERSRSLDRIERACRASRSAPMIWLVLVVQMPDPGDER